MRLARIGFWLSVISLPVIEAYQVLKYFLTKYEGNDPSLPGFLLVSPVLIWVPTLVVIWLGVVVAAVLRKGRRALRES